MEHHLLTPLLQVIAEDRKTDPDDLSAANLAAWRLLRGPYLAPTYDSWHLAEVADGQWRLEQQWLDREWIRRDPLTPFYRDLFWDEDNDLEDVFSLEQIKEDKKPQRRVENENALSNAIRQKADRLLDLMRMRDPELVKRLLSPSAEQLAARKSLQIECLDCDGFVKRVGGLLGNACDWTLKTYGMEYHTHPNYNDREHLFLVAHNNDEIAGILKIHVAREWTYAVGYVCTAPGWRNAGLSKQLYAKFIERCQQDDKVLVRTDPGDRTPPEATLAYDRMIRESRIVHAGSLCPMLGMMEVAHKAGVTLTQHVDRLKPACDAAIPDRKSRLGGLGNSYQRQKWLREEFAPLFQELIDAVKPSQPRKRRTGP